VWGPDEHGERAHVDLRSLDAPELLVSFTRPSSLESSRLERDASASKNSRPPLLGRGVAPGGRLLDWEAGDLGFPTGVLYRVGTLYM